MAQPAISLNRANRAPAPLTEDQQPDHTPPAAAARTVTAAIVETPISAPAEVERMVVVGSRIPESLHRSVKLHCVANGIEMQSFVKEALTEHLARRQGK